MNWEEALPLAINHMELLKKIEQAKANPRDQDIKYYDRKQKEYKLMLKNLK